MTVLRTIRRLVPLLLLAGCSGDPGDVPVLAGRALLPADTFAPGPSVGHALVGEFNGRTPPFSQVPVQGFSSLVLTGDTTAVALQDNGFGSRANSGDVPLRFYELTLDLQAGTVRVDRVVDLADPDGHIPFTLRGRDPERVLTGGDLDPESFVLLPDGTFWVGEEFGPFMLHFAANGRLLAPPVAVAVPDTLRPVARGRRSLRSPDHPDLRSLNDEIAVAQANLPRSGGLEGMALDPDGQHLYVAVEKALHDDPWDRRRLILEFDTGRADFTGRWWTWVMDGPGLSIASLACTPGGTLLLTERDELEGAAATYKLIYRAVPDAQGRGGVLEKTLVVDLLHLADPDGWTRAEDGSIGLGPRYSFPYVTPECLAIRDTRTLLVANDNNYPFSAGRRPRVPDDNEFILIRLQKALD